MSLVEWIGFFVSLFSLLFLYFNQKKKEQFLEEEVEEPSSNPSQKLLKPAHFIAKQPKILHQKQPPHHKMKKRSSGFQSETAQASKKAETAQHPQAEARIKKWIRGPNRLKKALISALLLERSREI